MPYFIEELQVTAIDMGKEMPVIRRAANPYLDERGFWVELDVSYGGGFQMTIETKMNLMKLKSNSPKQSSSNSGAGMERSVQGSCFKISAARCADAVKLPL